MIKKRAAVMLAGAVLLVVLPLTVHADESGNGSVVPEEVPTHGWVCYTHNNWPYVHVCIP